MPYPVSLAPIQIRILVSEYAYAHGDVRSAPDTEVWGSRAVVDLDGPYGVVPLAPYPSRLVDGTQVPPGATVVVCCGQWVAWVTDDELYAAEEIDAAVASLQRLVRRDRDRALAHDDPSTELVRQAMALWEARGHQGVTRENRLQRVGPWTVVCCTLGMPTTSSDDLGAYTVVWYRDDVYYGWSSVACTEMTTPNACSMLSMALAQQLDQLAAESMPQSLAAWGIA